MSTPDPLAAIQAAVERAAAFQQYADENGFGRPVRSVHPEAAMTDLAQSLVDAAAEAIAKSEDGDGFDGTWQLAGRAAAAAVVDALAAAEKTFGVGTLEDLADSIEKGG